MQSTRYVVSVLDSEKTSDSVYIFLQVWVKPNGEMPFLYGNHVLKAHLGRITEDTPEHQGVVVYSMKDIPLVRAHVREEMIMVLSACLHPLGLRRDR